MDSDAAQAVIRFGLGRRPAEPAPSDPHGWLLAQLDGPDPALARPGASAADGFAALETDRAARRANQPGTAAQALWERERAAMAEALLEAASPFRERLAWFWANHFTVSVKRGEAALVGPYLREAIRPNVTGRFVDMLLAVMTHPAMLLYLDNSGSVGPDSVIGRQSHGGLNENLGRECLELHTVGAAAGYSQADVTAFAAVLTGWTVQMQPPAPGFLFRADKHQPGQQTVMGQSFPPGMTGGIAALTWLADHPATHRRLATSLVRHFVADDPPPDAVRAVEAALRDSRGDLGAASRTLVGLPAAWNTPLAKLRDPASFVVAALRALDLPADQRGEAPHWMEALGQGLFAAPLPNGWADVAAPWSGGEALLRRADWAWAVSGRAMDRDPDELLAQCLGPFAGAATTAAVRRAGSRREALTLLLAGPEFQRR